MFVKDGERLMLQAIDIIKRFDNSFALNGISFEAQAGQVFALLGPNGAGKTTMLRLIMQILTPDSGEIRYNGQTIQKLKKNISLLIKLIIQKVTI